jgi:hypothetical protein
LLQPFRDRALDYRLAELRHLDLCRHSVDPPPREAPRLSEKSCELTRRAAPRRRKWMDLT